MTILVIAEHDNASIKAATLNTIAAAQKIGGDIHVLVAGSNAQAAADAAAKIAGVAKVLLADAPQLADGLAENVDGDGAADREGLLAYPRAGDRRTARTSRRVLPRIWTSRRSATSPQWIAPTRSSVRSTRAMPSRPFNRAIRSRSSRCVRRVSIRWRQKAAAHRWRRSKQRRTRASPSS